jgi:hypothetical protein
MTGDKEVWRLAAALMARHRSNALEEVERRAQAALDNDDVVGHGLWRSAREALVELLRPVNDNDPVS